MRMRKNRFKCRYGIMIVSAMIVSALILPRVYAAAAIETDRTDCTIEVDLWENGASELHYLPVEIDFYKVADVSAAGIYTVVDELNNLDMETPLDFADIDSETTHAEWQEKAAIAKEAVGKAEMEPTVSCVTEAGMAVADNLSVGLYLVDAQQTESELYTYNFIPYLISLPNNYYSAEDEASVDAWVYDLVGDKALTLKTERLDRYGDLEITKELKVYNETVGGAYFVFQVEAFKTDVDSKEKVVVYSNVVSLLFENPGKDSIVIEDIPAGAEVVVKEVYSGAGYKLESDAEVNVMIVADETVKVNFTNTYDERLNGGYGVVNNFVYNSETQEWTWEATEDSAQ